MPRYAYHDLYTAQFEQLVVAICSHLLGTGIQPFSSGRDGGRDARFQGTATHLPNAAAPHQGQFVVQAKHTEHPFAKFSDPDFSGDAKSSVLSQEIPRVRDLVAGRELDHYLLFSNRRLSGTADADIRHRLQAETQARTVELFGVERMELLLKRWPDIARIADISEVNLPLRVSPDDLAEVVLALAANKAKFAEALRPIERTSFARKNQINQLSDRFAKLIRSQYLSLFGAIHQFLAAPTNASLLERYREAAAEFNEQIIAHRHEWDTFDKVLVNLQTFLFDRDSDLVRNKRLTKAVIYYMYWYCDLGEEDDVHAAT